MQLSDSTIKGQGLYDVIISIKAVLEFWKSFDDSFQKIPIFADLQRPFLERHSYGIECFMPFISLLTFKTWWPDRNTSSTSKRLRMGRLSCNLTERSSTNLTGNQRASLPLTKARLVHFLSFAGQTGKQSLLIADLISLMSTRCSTMIFSSQSWVENFHSCWNCTS